jgi:pantothenate kinase-related protein Tda10
MTEMLDHALPFIGERLDLEHIRDASKPMFIGINGVQGAGKTTLVS